MNSAKSVSIPATTLDSEKSIDSVSNGLALSIWIAFSAIGVHKVFEISFVSPMIMAIFLGVLYKSLIRVPENCHRGIAFSQTSLLKIAIVLLGLQLSFTQVLSVGWNGLVAIALTMASTFLFCLWVGNLLGLDARLTRLIAAGTSICGASAIAATNSVVKAKDEHVAYSLAIVTLFGFLSMVLFPIIGQYLALNPTIFGFWSGVSIHETAQVVAASFQGGEQSGEVGTITKLSRVLLLIPVLVILSISKQSGTKDDDTKRIRFPLPWFILGFLALVTLNSFYPINAEVGSYLKTGTKFLLIVALAAIGLQMDFSKICKAGWRPLCLGAFAWIFISVVGLLMATFFLNGDAVALAKAIYIDIQDLIEIFSIIEIGS